MKPPVFLTAGMLSYDAGRELQRQLIDECLKGGNECRVIFCEHPPVITLGQRAGECDISHQNGYLLRSNIPCIDVDRGGGATYHGPGQLVIYPVISLRAIRRGVREFVERGLISIAETVREYGVRDVQHRLSPCGVWVGSPPAKIAAVGLRIVQGVTDHGFSLNVSSDTAVYRHFVPCGQPGVGVTSLSEILGCQVPLEDVAERLAGRLSRCWQSAEVDQTNCQLNCV